MTEDSSDETPERPATAALPVVEPADLPRDPDSRSDAPAVAGVLLAAGTSSRFGDENKLLATVEGEPVVRHAARTLVRSAVDPVVAVLGHEADRVRSELEGLAVETVVNEAYDTGQASSLRTGIRAIRERDREPDAAVVALGDMPFVSPASVDTLVTAYAADAGDAIAAAFDGTRGNPVLFDERFFDALTDVDGDVGGREILLESDASVLVSVDDPGVRRDIDVPGDV
ncbi:nucleotidyltransferase family protein [Halosolutus halophilus]|uniref:nucleotidyltransferase family protein n=1 Tax=Halosolutus halophilus TaxID=1552990 RepID=UPI00223507D6|nr:nucleotidyltransferase family protein [Halosolutus halophilus]